MILAQKKEGRILQSINFLNVFFLKGVCVNFTELETECTEKCET